MTVDPLLAKALGCFALAVVLIAVGLFIDPLVKVYDHIRAG